MDVGMNDGADTAFYLAKGFEVVAVEADPELVVAACERFSVEIAEGRLCVIEAAIAETAGTTRFAIADGMTIWSTLDPEFLRRNAKIEYRYVEVRTVRFADLLREHGVPYYLKVDIEGLDMLPVRALHELGDRPRYVSLESSVSSNLAPFDRVFDELAELWSLGYRGFKYVNQRRLGRVRLPPRPLEGTSVADRPDGHWSGPFGRETPGRWLAAGQALALAQFLRTKHNIGGYGGRWRQTPPGFAYAATRMLLLRRAHSWYDLHARMGD